MIKRDNYGFVCQHDINDRNYMDGGDTARTTGILALTDSMKDQLLAAKLEIEPGMLTRHPFQVPWNNPLNFTRDQLTCAAAGLYKAGRSDVVRRTLLGVIKRGFRAQNKEKDFPGTTKTSPDGADIIGPDVLWHLILCARLYPLYIFAPLGYLFQGLSMLYNVYVAPDKEQNQFYCMAKVSGLYPIYKRLHPDLAGNLRGYWGGWRDQIEIAEEMLK